VSEGGEYAGSPVLRVLKCELGCAVGIVGLNCVDDRFVLTDHLIDPDQIMVMKTKAHQPVELLGQCVVDSGHTGVARHVSHGTVESSVIVYIFGLRAGVIDVAAELVECTDGDIITTRRARGTSRFDEHAKAKDVLDIRQRDRIDPIPLPRHDRHQIFLFQTKQGVPDRRSTDMITLGQYLFSQFLAGAELACEDRISNRLVNAVTQQHHFTLPLPVQM